MFKSTMKRLYKIVFALLVAYVIVRTGFDIASGHNTTASKQLSSNLNTDNEEKNQDKDDNVTMVRERNQIRLARVEHVCNTRLNAEVSGKIGHINMDANHDITLCRVNKAASTYTIGLLRTIFNISRAQMSIVTTKVKKLPEAEMRKTIDNSFLFKFVREPYGRLFSTYSNKFYLPKSHWAPVAPKIVKRYRENPSKDSLIYGHNITFYEMIKFTVEEFEAGKKLDRHLSPMNYLCNPCNVKYDFIGKLETIVSDWSYLKHEWSRKLLIHVPTDAGERRLEHFNETNHMKDTFAIIKDSTISKYKLYLRAWTYYKILGHIYKHIDMPYTENSKIEFDDFKRALEEAANKSKPYAEEAKQQKGEAFRQAYASIPLRLLERLSKVVALDCMLYGYDNKPDWLFSRKNAQSDYDYFQGLD